MVWIGLAVCSFTEIWSWVTI